MWKILSGKADMLLEFEAGSTIAPRLLKQGKDYLMRNAKSSIKEESTSGEGAQEPMVMFLIAVGGTRVKN